MDSKRIPDEELPPPYSVHVGDQASASHNAQEASLTSHLQQHLTSLPSRIRMNREAHSVQQSLDDASLLDLLLPEIDDFLAYLGGLHNTPKLAHLTIVPETVVPQNAILSGMEEMRRRGEICRVARVNINPSHDEKKSPAGRDSNRDASTSQDWSVGREFSDWGRFGDSTSSTDPSQAHSMLWWKDEEMAHRLARHLQPPTEPTPLQTPVQATVEERLPAQKPKKGWFWGNKNSSSSSTSTFATKTVQADVESFPGRDNTARTVQKSRGQETGGARMSVTAEEVAFRIENDLGIVESARGWAVVVAVHVKT
ncbi:hypothetical protein F4859DRAFT_108428 [Xylaria cf. heliscus]|nr:hypothetical protein F4859DRAFT_108428 [Xylaria cf. heliscus]